jgi:DUF4097 and DUF4098 domain-containing protein YvlB
MKTSVKVFLSLGIGLFVLGIVVAGVGFAMAKGDFSQIFSAAEQIEGTRDFSGEDVTDLVIANDYNDISIVPSADEDIHITYYEAEKDDYTFTVADGTLTIAAAEKEWWRHIGVFHFQAKTMVIEVPESLFSVSVDVAASALSMADITIEGNLVIDTDAGAVTLSRVDAKNLSVDASAGSVIFNDVTTGKIEISANAGRVDFNDVAAGYASVRTDAGKVDWQNVAITEIAIESAAGAVLLDTVTVGAASIETDAGKIEFSKLAVNEGLTLSSDFGSIRGTLFGDLSDFTITSQVDAGESNLPTFYQGGDKSLDVSANAGSIEIEFLK